MSDPKISDTANLVESVEEVYDVVGTRNERWVRFRTDIKDLGEATEDAQNKALFNQSAKWYLVKRTTTVTEELIEVETPDWPT